MAYRKLGRRSDQRKAILRNLTTALLWNGKIETTEARAKEVRSIAEKLITLAIKEYNNTEIVTKNGEQAGGETSDVGVPVQCTGSKRRKRIQIGL